MAAFVLTIAITFGSSDPTLLSMLQTLNGMKSRLQAMRIPAIGLVVAIDVTQ